MRRECVGHPGYYINIEGEKIWFEKNGKTLTNQICGDKIYWQVCEGKKKWKILADKLVADTFPELERGSYIYSLYKGVKNTVCQRTRTVKIAPAIFLTTLYTQTSYLLETPPGMGLKKELKEMFPGPLIYIEEGNETRRWDEYYFTSEECLVCMTERMRSFFRKKLDVLE